MYLHKMTAKSFISKSDRARFISKAEVARALGMTYRNVLYLVSDGKIPIDEKGFIPRAEFNAWLAAKIKEQSDGT
jgi:hypothetical protein